MWNILEKTVLSLSNLIGHNDFAALLIWHGMYEIILKMGIEVFVSTNSGVDTF